MPQTIDPVFQLLAELEQKQRQQEAQQLEAERKSRDARAALFYGAQKAQEESNSRFMQSFMQSSPLDQYLSNQAQLANNAANNAARMQYGMMQQQTQMERAPIDTELAIYDEIKSRELPEHIAAGLQPGVETFMYDRDQKRELANLEDSISKAQRATNLSPFEKAQFMRQQAEKAWEIRSNPKRNPNPPPSSQQQFETDAPIVWDEVTQKNIRVTRDRNGIVRPFEEKKQEKAVDPNVAVFKQNDETRKQEKHDRAMQSVDLKDKLAMLELDKPKQEDYTRPDEDGDPEPDTERYQVALNQYNSLLAGFKAWYAQQGAQSTPQPGAPAQPGQSPPIPPQEGQQPTIIGPNAAGRYARKYPDGRVELLPEGFTPQ